MKKKKTNYLNSKLLYKIVALFFAILLFAYVNSSHLSSTRQQNNDAGFMSNKAVTMTVPLKINIDSDKYFVSGYPEEVKVKITGPTAMVVATENVRNFEVYADLNGLSLGDHTVKLKTTGLNDELTVSVVPAHVNVKISKKKHVVLPIQVRFDANQIAKNYAAGTAYASQQTAEITGSKQDIKRIDSVVADIQLPSKTQKTYTRSVLLKAIDKNGHLLDVNIYPATVKVTVPVYEALASKKVNIDLIASGAGVAGKKYSFSSETKTVEVKGTKKALADLTTLKVPISIMGIVNNQVKTIQINPSINGITQVNPKVIEVKIVVTDSSDKEDKPATKKDKDKVAENN
ncbi:CdaR family protein [Ligilactobacillus ceti]|uniref:YbbR-like protein n=1 Tax=Ligilactobacillus ceti DSM 22408 TaxID=1122146 RepID=A0A0R2KSM0_9LACO|nr:CdaR family protein [Ligilactobacillus ceti]KRN89996.1 hypothetical protein IV53_GL001114 [Ligilactobacillus ceti DSM 22408]